MRPQPKIGPRSPATYAACINHIFPEQEEDFRLLGEVGGGGGDRIRKWSWGKEGRPPGKPLHSLVVEHTAGLGPRTL